MVSHYCHNCGAFLEKNSSSCPNCGQVQTSNHQFISVPTLSTLSRSRRSRSRVAIICWCLLLLLGVSGLSVAVYRLETGSWLWDIPHQSQSSASKLSVSSVSYNHSWIPRASSINDALTKVTWLDSQFIALSSEGPILTSRNGDSWEAEAWTASINGTNEVDYAQGITNLTGIAWSGTQFVAVSHGSGLILTSPDGHTWTVQMPFPGNDLFPRLGDVIWSGTQFVAVAYVPGNPAPIGEILTSQDGATWTVQYQGQGDLSGLVWTGSQFVVVGENGTILTSPDGHNWAAQNSGTSEDLNRVFWLDSRFIVLGSGPSLQDAPCLLTSADGSTWTMQHLPNQNSLPIASNFSDIVWSGSQFVIIGGYNGFGGGHIGIIWTSRDGQNWIAQYQSSLALASLVWTGSQFVVVGENGTILTSFDGHTWTLQRSDVRENLADIAWSGKQLVAVGENGLILTPP